MTIRTVLFSSKLRGLLFFLLLLLNDQGSHFLLYLCGAACGHKLSNRQRGAVLHVMATILFDFFLCPAYTDYRVKFVPRKLLQPPSTYHFCIHALHKVEICFCFVKICTGSKHYVTPQTSAIDRYYCVNILLV